MGTKNLSKIAKFHSDHKVVEKKSEKQITKEKIVEIVDSYRHQTDLESVLKEMLDGTKGIFFLDISCFLSETNFDATLNFLNHPDFKLKNSDHRIEMENKSFRLLGALREKKISKDQDKYLNELLKFYFPGAELANKKRMKWIKSESYRKQLQELTPFNIHATEPIGEQDSEIHKNERSASKSILNSIRTIARKAENVKSFFLGLGSKFGNIIKKLYKYTIVLPHTKKIEWFGNLKLKAKIFFGITIPAEVFAFIEPLKDKIMKEISSTLSEETIKLLKEQLIKNLLEFFASANQSLRDLVASIDLVSLASFIVAQIVPILDYVIAGGLGSLALFLIFNSVEQLKGFVTMIQKKKKFPKK